MIRCPTCGSETSVLETRDAPAYVRRRRLCDSEACRAKITTLEIVLTSPAHSPGGNVVLVRRRDLDALRAIADRMASVDIDVPPVKPASERRVRNEAR
jgi:hypothetical protein